MLDRLYRVTRVSGGPRVRRESDFERFSFSRLTILFGSHSVSGFVSLSLHRGRFPPALFPRCQQDILYRLSGFFLLACSLIFLGGCVLGPFSPESISLPRYSAVCNSTAHYLERFVKLKESQDSNPRYHADTRVRGPSGA